jgi:hypothetical protein
MAILPVVCLCSLFYEKNVSYCVYILITGEIEFVELCGPEVTLSLHGRFWHRRETVLGRAAMWLNACMPEIVSIKVEELDELQDFMQVKDEFTALVFAV